jgi:leucyl/phenylalanyl-tRNA---protein transferase
MLRLRLPISSRRKKLLAEPIRLDLDLLLSAYAQGMFPMADARDAPDVYWVEPKRRAILPLDQFHISKSLDKTLKSGRFLAYHNFAFAEVVQHCAEEVEGRPSTWINAQIEEAVLALHARGHAHSFECWSEGKLVGGLYGISLGRAFFGESMFSRTTDASKVALVALVAWMKDNGFALLDCQFLTPHLASLGAIEIGRLAYLKLLRSAVG